MANKQTNASTGRGAIFQVSINGTDYTAIGGVKMLSFSAPKSNFDPTTNLSSPNAIEETIPTTIDPGSMSATIVWDQVDQGQQFLYSQFYTRTPLTCQVLYPAQAGLTHGPSVQFNGFVSENGIVGADVTKAAEYSIGIKITGMITTTAGS